MGGSTIPPPPENLLTCSKMDAHTVATALQMDGVTVPQASPNAVHINLNVTVPQAAVTVPEMQEEVEKTEQPAAAGSTNSIQIINLTQQVGRTDAEHKSEGSAAI